LSFLVLVLCIRLFTADFFPWQDDDLRIAGRIGANLYLGFHHILAVGINQT